MKRIVKYLICGLTLAGLIAGGCALGPPHSVNGDFARNERLQPANFAPSDAQNFKPDQLWVIERDTNISSAIPASPPLGGLTAVVHGHEHPMPLKSMNVDATMHGYISTVDIKQQFENPYTQKIEAVYEFHLPEQAGVDDFVMTIGSRKIRGIIRERKVAEAIYQQAKQLGFLALLLSTDQTNTFHQTIANIEPGNNIDVDIHYFQTLHFQDGWFEFRFPTTANAKGSSDSQRVPVSFLLDVDAGATIADLQCPDYLTKKSLASEHWIIQSKPEVETPNEDLKLRYRLAKGQSSSDFMSYRDQRGGYFTLLLHPPDYTSTLTNVKVDWGAMKVSEIYPSDFTNLPAGRAVLIAGRFMGTVPPAITVTGTEGNQTVSFSIPVDISKANTEKMLPKVWASMKIATFKQETLRTGDLGFISETKQVALEYGVASPFTPFLAVDASEPTKGDKSMTVPAAP